MKRAANSGKAATGKPFQKGVSGNPAGRPKVVEEFRARARRAVDERIIDAWIAEVEAQGPDWVKCSELLAAYGYGKPSQTVDLGTSDTGPAALELVMARLRALPKGARDELEEGLAEEVRVGPR